MSQTAIVDWEHLHDKAVAAMRRAYAPYSRFPVGVAGLVDDGRIVSGCNVENAAYGVTLCAECGMVSQLHLSGGGVLRQWQWQPSDALRPVPPAVVGERGARVPDHDIFGRPHHVRGAARCLRRH
jgi:hypothetical protein